MLARVKLQKCPIWMAFRAEGRHSDVTSGVSESPAGAPADQNEIVGHL
jgi:hypothetical protein